MVGPRALLTVILLGAGALPAVAPAAAQVEARAAIEALRRAQRSEVSSELLAALRGLAAHDEPVVVDELLATLEAGESHLFPLVRALLGSYSDPATIKRLLSKGVKSRLPAVREQVILALGEGRPAALDWQALAEEALADPSAAVRAAAVRSLGRAHSLGQLERILELALDEHERVRAEVAGALVRLAGERALPVLQKLVADPRWRVRLAAAQALADMKTPPAVEGLVDALVLERGRLREDFVALLERLTGRSLGTDIAGWRALLLEAPPDLLSHGDTMALRRQLPPRYVGEGLRYYTVGTSSERFALITDVSASMSTPVALAGPAQAGREQPQTRLLVAQTELQRLLGSFSPQVSFNLICFGDVARAWKPAPVPAEERTVRAALAEVGDYRADGNTNLFEALALAFDAAETAIDSPLARPGDIDTLFLLSDGAPSIGKLQDTELLLAWVGERNRVLQLRIHCLSLTSEENCLLLLQQLADLGNGQFVQLVAPGR
ncbi:MAG: HEAT repeat domain-containing protein [Planctomycetota bacterium]